MSDSVRFARRTLLALGLGAAALPLAAAPTLAANAAETFVAENINMVMAILNNKALSTEQRRAEFEQLLLGLIDMNRIAIFTLGNYRRTASPAEIQAYEAAFQDYATATYQFYFSKYTGQTLKVTGSQSRTPDDIIVTTQLIDPNDHSGRPPLEVDFRVRTNTGKPVLVDVSVEGIWLTLSQRDMVVSVLGNGNGNIAALDAQLHQMAASMRSGNAPAK
jgi:phospholipid transport system substrate-binding protein